MNIESILAEKGDTQGHRSETLNDQKVLQLLQALCNNVLAGQIP